MEYCTKQYEKSSISYPMLVNKLDNCKEKGNNYVKGHIKEIQDIYKQEDIEMKEPETKEK